MYAGAGGLVVSMWRVADDITLRLMEHMYQQLAAGDSKAAALRHAQRTILVDNPGLHPAFWGAFQLVGDPQPLSSGSVVRRQAGGPADGTMHWVGQPSMSQAGPPASPHSAPRSGGVPHLFPFLTA